jgi:hypothetical protein
MLLGSVLLLVVVPVFYMLFLDRRSEPADAVPP